MHRAPGFCRWGFPNQGSATRVRFRTPIWDADHGVHRDPASAGCMCGGGDAIFLGPFRQSRGHTHLSRSSGFYVSCQVVSSHTLVFHAKPDLASCALATIKASQRANHVAGKDPHTSCFMRTSPQILLLVRERKLSPHAEQTRVASRAPLRTAVSPRRGTIAVPLSQRPRVV